MQHYKVSLNFYEGQDPTIARSTAGKIETIKQIRHLFSCGLREAVGIVRDGEAIICEADYLPNMLRMLHAEWPELLITVRKHDLPRKEVWFNG